MKRAVKKLSETEVANQYPIQGRLLGWYFRLSETSNGVWLAEGIDLWGRKVSCLGTNDATLIKECETMAQYIVAVQGQS
jgi:hypothetical protein